MKAIDVKIGSRYKIRIGGQFTTVLVTHAPEARAFRGGKWWRGRNEQTGRELRFTAAKLRSEVSVRD